MVSIKDNSLRRAGGKPHYLLRTSGIHNLGAMLGFLTIDPRQVDDKLARDLIMTGIDGLHCILP
jgi:hypothetical protein